MVTATWKIEMEFSGAGNGWSDVSADVQKAGGLHLGYGIRGTTASDRVAPTGPMTFDLDNSEYNSASLLGYYAPGHVNCRAGFALGIGVRFSITYGGTTYYKWRGSLDSIDPIPGRYRERVTMCSAVDWMDDAARYPLSQIPIQIAKRSDEIFSTIVAAVPRQPAALEVQTGLDTYPYALDNTQDENARALSEFQTLAMSELGYIYVKGDTVQGGTLVFEARSYRPSQSTNLATLNETMVEMQVGTARDAVLNRVLVTSHPRSSSPSSTAVLFTLPAGTVPAIEANNVLILTCPYRDPATGGYARAGAETIVTPAPTTDYSVNSQADGLGTDLTSLIVMDITKGGNSSAVAFTNTTGVTGYLTKFQLRGQGLFDYTEVVSPAEDTDSQATYGLSVLSFDMPLQGDQAVAAEVAQYLLNLSKTPQLSAPSVTFMANRSDALMLAMLKREISDRIGLTETATGLSTIGSGTRGWFINSVDIEVLPGAIFLCTWGLVPADRSQYWLLEVIGRGELGINTRLGFGLILGHTDIAHLDAHGDTAHADVAHTDTHTDDAHGDVAAHSDGSHGDSAYIDVAHSDASHTDAHTDVTYQDSAYEDTAHQDSHSDVAHTDSEHIDVSYHWDVAHTDVAHWDHYDGHNDGGYAPEDHTDQEHVDTPYWDGSDHFDSYADVAHVDAHSDVAHMDVAHVDVTHVDTHSDVVHGDVTHQDVAHVDTSDHGDVAHTDTAHGDVAHDDVTHQDTALVNEHGDVAYADVN